MSLQPGGPRRVQPGGRRHRCNEGRGTKSHFLMQTVPVWARDSSPRAGMRCPIPDVTHVGTALGTVLAPAHSQGTASLLLIFRV